MMAGYRGAMGRTALHCLIGVSLVGILPAVCHARGASTSNADDPPIKAPPPPPGAALPPVEPIITDEEFEAAIPKISAEDDPELARPLESIDEFERRIASEQAGAKPAEGQEAPLGDPALADSQKVESIGDAPVRDAELTKPLPPLETFKVEPAQFAKAENAGDNAPVEIAYRVQLDGLAEADTASDADIAGRFSALSALRRGNGKVANAAQLASRTEEDVLLLKKLLAAQGWFDAQVTTRIDQAAEGANQPMQVVFAVAPGKRFRFSSIKVEAEPTVPADLVGANLPLQTGDPVVAEKVIGAEAQVALALPVNGYPFAKVGERDVLLDQDSGGADYTLSVTTGPRSRYGAIVSQGKEAFAADHVAVLARFKPGELYDSRKVHDLRQALIATGLFRGIGVEPRRTGQAGPDGTETVDLVVTQEAGPPRVIAGTAGYGTGEGFRVEASWTHRNLFPPEGALTVSGVAGTQEQGASAVFRRSNAGKRDRSFELGAELHHSNYDAFSAYTGRLSARVSYDSTPLWQKRITYSYGAQIIGTNESAYDFALGTRTRRTYAIAGLSGQIGFDTTDSLLDPSKGYRVIALVEPEGSLSGAFSPYARLRLDGSAYYKVGDNVILAGRIKVATIQGVRIEDLAPSRRLYAGGGGSVRGFGYQQLGPRDPAGDPIGARSLNEAAGEVRYRFGDYGVVAFADVGQAYTSAVPQFSDLRVGVGLGARLYTNFGPMRIDVATPLRRQPGESRLNVYVSIGQAF